MFLFFKKFNVFASEEAQKAYSERAEALKNIPDTKILHEEEIKRIFVTLRAYFTKTEKTDSFSSILNDSSDAIVKLEKCLLAEVYLGKGSLAVETAQKLQSTINTINNRDTSVKEKLNAVYAFRNFARNSKLGFRTRVAIDAFVVSLIPLIVAAIIVASLGGFPALGATFGIASAIYLPVSTALGYILTSILTSNLVPVIPLFFSTNDNRGKDVHQNLEKLVRAEEEGRILHTTSNSEVSLVIPASKL